jgi:hypothetical protein
MKMPFVVLVMLASTGLWVAPAVADKAGYCQAYARDFSDSRATDKSEWQHKYDIALDACLAGGTKAAAEQAPAQPAPGTPKAVVAKPVVKAPQPAKPAEAADQTPVPIVQPASESALPKLVVGSPEWNDYCAKKYTSFSAKTGMYLSHTGVSRRCLVTKDFKG